MTDDDLLLLVQTKLPEDFTPEEVAALRKGIRESVKLRTAIFDTLQMESHLTAALGSFELQPEAIADRAEQSRRGRLQPLLGLLALALCIGFIALSIAVFRSALRPEEIVVAGPDEEKKPDEEQPPEEKKETPVEQPSTETPVVAPADKPAEKAPPAGETKVAAAPPAVPVALPEPWREVMKKDPATLPNFYDVCFEEFNYRAFVPRAADLKRWFEAVPGSELRISETDSRRAKCGFFEGTARLKAPLPVDGGLRFAVRSDSRFRIYAYRGEQGVMLRWFPDQRDSWGAYQVTRKGREVKPLTYVLASTDEDRARRTEVRLGGVYELRYVVDTKELVLIRGDVVLLRAPLAAPPDDVILEGKTIIEGISLVRTKDFPLVEEQTKPTLTLTPAKLEWREKFAKNVAMEKRPDGSVRLASTAKTDTISYAFTNLPGVGPREITFEIDEATPGFAVLLGRRNKDDLADNLRFVLNKRTNRLALQMQGYPSDQVAVETDSLPERLERSAAPRYWVRMLFGCGPLRWWQSADGIHWASGDPTGEWAPDQITSVGILLGKHDQPVSGVLKSVAIRELPYLTKLAPRELVEKAPSLSKAKTYEEWLLAVLESKPLDADFNAWRRACALRTLGDGSYIPVSTRILDRLLDDPVAQALPLDDQLGLLREALTMLVDVRDNETMRSGMVARFWRLAERLDDAGDKQAFTKIRRVAMETSLWTFHQYTPIDPETIQRFLLRKLRRGEFEGAAQIARELRLFRYDERSPLLEWAEYLAHEERGEESEESLRRRDSWRQLWVEELNKESYNFTAELNSLIDGGSFVEAAKSASGIEADGRTGLTPAGRDPDLFVDLPAMLTMAYERHPKLREEMQRSTASLAQLRVKQAVASGDEAVLRLAAVQFAGTDAAAEAHRRLGDRALQNGWFSVASAEYRQASESAGALLSRELAPRARLAAAMQGIDHGSPVTSPVAFGNLRMSAEEFEAMVKDLRSRGTDALTPVAAAGATILPPPSLLESHNRARLDGPVGQSPQDEGARGMQTFQVDPIGRQIAAAVDGDTLYVTNRFQLAAYQLSDGKRKWQSQTPSGEMRRGQDWALVPMRPLLLGNVVVMRTLFGKTPSLTGFEKSSGKVLWHREGTDNEGWASDPIMVQGQVIALRHLRGDGTGTGDRLQMNVVDPLTGDILNRKILLQLRDVWQWRKCCETAAIDDGFLVALGGVSFRCDGAGNVRWVRRHFSPPAEQRPEWVRQSFSPPIIVQDRAILLQPGVETIDCLDTATGALLWSVDDFEPRRILGRVGDLLIAESFDGFLAFNAQDGKVAWRTPEMLTRLTAAAVSDKYVLYSVRRHDPENNRHVPIWVWLDAADGRELGRVEALPLADQHDPRLGPLVSAGGKLWTFFARERDGNRDFVELIAKPDSSSVFVSTNDIWLPRLRSTITEPITQRFSPWRLISGVASKESGFRADYSGDKNVVVIQAKLDVPIALVAEPKIPAEKKARLKMHIARTPQQKWKWEVRLNGELLAEREIDPAKDKERMVVWEPELPGVAGKTGRLTATFRLLDGTEHHLSFQKFELGAE